MPMCRREPPTEIVPLIINFGSPFRLVRSGRPVALGRRTAVSRPARTISTCSSGPPDRPAGLQVNLSILGARLFLGRPLKRPDRTAPLSSKTSSARDASRLASMRSMRRRHGKRGSQFSIASLARVSERADPAGGGAVRLASSRRQRRPRQHRRDRRRDRLQPAAPDRPVPRGDWPVAEDARARAAVRARRSHHQAPAAPTAWPTSPSTAATTTRPISRATSTPLPGSRRPSRSPASFPTAAASRPTGKFRPRRARPRPLGCPMEATHDTEYFSRLPLSRRSRGDRLAGAHVRI